MIGIYQCLPHLPLPRFLPGKRTKQVRHYLFSNRMHFVVPVGSDRILHALRTGRSLPPDFDFMTEKMIRS